MKKFSPFVIVHLILMFGLVLCASFSAILFLGRFDFAVAGKDNAQVIAAGCTMFVILLMLLSGILYLFNEYSKRAAIFYKVFLCLIMIVDVTVGLAIHGKYADKAERGSN